MTLQPQDLRYLGICEEVKSESHDPVRPVGAALVAPGGVVVSTGTNRPPPETLITKEGSFAAFSANPELRYYLLEHAERDAISNARRYGRETLGTTAYCTLFPCADCARAMIAAGVKRLVAPLPEYDLGANRKWELHFIFAKELFGLAGVELDLFTPAILASARKNKKLKRA